MEKEKKYRGLLEQMKSLISSSYPMVSNLANMTALIKEKFGFLWIGFYMVGCKSGMLELGPFQGSVACYTIGYGKGVCGTVWERGESVVVEDVEKFDGHIACSSLSRSEIVVPLFNNERTVVGVLDIDSEELAKFDETDRDYLEKAMELLSKELFA